MSLPEQVGVAVPILAVLSGVGLIKRDRLGWGISLVTLGMGAILVLLVLGHARPLVGLIAMLGLLGGFIADERGHRAFGLAGVSVGVFALLIAIAYT